MGADINTVVAGLPFPISGQCIKHVSLGIRYKCFVITIQRISELVQAVISWYDDPRDPWEELRLEAKRLG